MVGTTLVRRASLQYFRKPVKDLSLSARGFCHEILRILYHKLEIDLVLAGAPPAAAYFLLVYLQTQFLDLMIFGLKTLRFRAVL